MSMHKVASAAIALAQQAARSEEAARSPALLSDLNDLLVHLGVLRVQCATLVHEHPAAVACGAACEADDADEAAGVEPTAIVGD